MYFNAFLFLLTLLHASLIKLNASKAHGVLKLNKDEELLIKKTEEQCLYLPSSLCFSESNFTISGDAHQSGLVAMFSFDDSAAVDVSGSGSTMRTVPKAGPASGGVGASADFSSRETVEIEHSASFESNQISISFWMYLLEDSTGTWRSVFHKGVGSHVTPTLQLWPRERRLHARISSESGGSLALDSNSIIPMYRWVHIAFIVEGKLMQIFINGYLDAEIITHSLAAYNTDPFVLGGVSSYIDDFKIYNKALSEADISLLATSTMYPSSSNRESKLGCKDCLLNNAVDYCTSLEADISGEAVAFDGYHLCTSKELAASVFNTARVQGWYIPNQKIWRLEDAKKYNDQFPTANIMDEKRTAVCCLNGN